MRSHLLEGTVRHRRARPTVYALEHDVYYLALDLDELDLVDDGLRLLARNRRGILEFRDRDHWPEPATDLRATVHGFLRGLGEDPTGWQITLVTNPRTFGYVFNPASFYLCRDAAGVLRIVIVEVHNTHGERHLYTLRPNPGSSAFVAAIDKDFYVSPFLETRGGYTVRVRDEPARLRITINHEAAEGLLLHASLDLVRRPLTARSVVRMLVRYPLVTHKTTLMIHWHALRLWLRGARFHRHREVAR
jgi:uncharacterized protein